MPTFEPLWPMGLYASIAIRQSSRAPAAANVNLLNTL